jgi:hypothetical protein
MMAWMLAELERATYRVFYQKELEVGFPKEFPQAVRERLLTRVPLELREGVVGYYSYRLHRPYLVYYEKGVLEAFDDEDPEVEPLLLSRADLVQWTLDLKGFALRIQEANGLTGKPEALSDRLYFVGEQDEEEGRTAFVLTLVSCEDMALEKLMALPGLLPRGYGRTLALCPSFQPSPTLRRRLQDLGLDLALLHFRAPDSFALDDFREQGALDLEFQHWDDYRSVRGRGPVLHLAPLQAQVVSILHQAALAGTPGLGWQSIRMRLSGNASSMRDIFKKSDPRSALVVYDSQSRLYRLNL